MKVLITYFSQTGNTAQVARAIQAEVSSREHAVEVREIGEVTAKDLNDYGLVYLGSACHDTDLARPVVRLLESVGDSPAFKLAGFCTHATYMPEGGERARELYETWAGNCVRTLRQVSEDKQIAFLGYFHCLGAPSLPIEAFIHNTIVTDEREWATYIASVRDHPDQVDLERARAFAGQVLEAYLT
jgi:flavodoxin